MTKRIIAVKETHELLIIRQPRTKEKWFCAGCQTQVRWLAPEEAMLLLKTNLREIFRLVETQAIHFTENGEGFLLVCAESLTNRQGKLEGEQ